MSIGCFLLVSLVIAHSTAHLVKEFTSAKREAARSMEPEKGGTVEDIDMAAALCEKYNEWSKWSSCSRKCDQTRVRRCRIPEECGKSWVKEKRTCIQDKGPCYPLTYKVIGMQRRNRLIEELLYDLLYAQWSAWGPCTRSCRQRRQRECKLKNICVRSYIQEERRCQIAGQHCEHRYSLKPVGLSKVSVNTTSSVTEDEQSNEEDDDGGENSNDWEDESKDNKNNIVISLTTPDLVNESQGQSKNRTKLENKANQRRKLAFEELTSAQKNCGIRPKNSVGSYRVVGGQEVRINSWPWQVAILTKYNEQYCGGTLIAPRWVLTAAHCVQKNNRRRALIVRVGEHDTQKFDSTQENIRPISEYPHPDFDYQTITNDIALIKLRHPPSAFTQPGYACLPSPDFKPKKRCTIVGWGKLKNNHIYGSDSLQEAQVPVVRHQRCRRVFEYNITSTQVCAGYKKGGIDSCAGDSGGPLLCTSQDDEKYFLYGVTSYGEGCGKKGKYGIYTKVSSYLDWIRDTIRDNR